MDSQVGTKQNTINDGDLTIAQTAELQTALDDKQDGITTDTDLTSKSLTTNNILSETFDTIVIRRPNGFSGNGTGSQAYTIILTEIQCWINANNILLDINTSSYFTDWTDKDVDIGQYLDNVSSNAYNNTIETGFGAVSPVGMDGNVALIISGFPTTEITKIQSIVYYNRQDGVALDKTLGLALELYSRENDVNLVNPLASSNEISVERDVYRFDFPSLSSYTADFSTSNSTSEIANDTLALKEVISYTGSNISCETLTTSGNVSVGGSLFLGDTNLTEDIDGLLTLDANKRLIINRLTSASVITGENNCDYLNTTFQGKFGIPDSGNDLTLSGTQINFNSDSFISNSAGSNSGNHLVIFINGIEYKIELENAS